MVARPPLVRTAAVYACTVGAMGEPGGASRMRAYMASARSADPSLTHASM
jgi:hypothetical protein